MSALQENFYYDGQFKRYLIQFMAIFGNMNVRVGANETKEARLIKVPIFNASKDRVVAAIKGENTQNKPLRIPALSTAFRNLEMAPEMRKGVPNTRRQTMMPTGGLYPDDIRVVAQRMPVPYKATFELSVWASNQDQHYQILEQILMLFNPILQIQTSDDQFDWTQLTTVELVSVGLEENIPIGAERRLIQTTLAFTVPVYMSVPADVHDKFVQEINIRIGAVSTDAINPYDIIAELDEQNAATITINSDLDETTDINDTNVNDDRGDPGLHIDYDSD